MQGYLVPCNTDRGRNDRTLLPISDLLPAYTQVQWSGKGPHYQFFLTTGGRKPMDASILCLQAASKRLQDRRISICKLVSCATEFTAGIRGRRAPSYTSVRFYALLGPTCVVVTTNTRVVVTQCTYLQP